MNNKSENKQNIVPEGELYGKEKIGKILLKNCTTRDARTVNSGIV